MLCSPYYQKIIQSKVVGDKDGFSGGRCKATLIPLPPLAEQKRIVDKIEELLKSISQKLGYICEDLYGNKKEGA